MAEKITYEHPINERIRIFLKLEYLFDHISFDNPLSSLVNILQISEISKRFDLRFECLQSLDRIHLNLVQLQKDGSNIDLQKLDETKLNIEKQINILKSGKGKFGEYIIQNEALNNIISKHNSPGGIITNELPYLKFWMQKPSDIKVNELVAMHKEFEPLRHAIMTILGFIRSSRSPKRENCQNGTFSKMLDNNRIQLIRVSLSKELNTYPEISGNSKFISIRFLTKELLKDKPITIKSSFDFDVFYCF